jgi:Tfp pilus assembly PilM family ATPase
MLTPSWITTSRKVQPIGLDIGHRSLKMVQLALGEDRPKVLAARRIPVASDAGDPREQEKAVVAAIQRLLADGQFRGRDVVSALPIDKIRITSLRLAEAELDQADRILRKEAAERFGLDPAKDAIDYLPAGSVRQGEEVKNEYILFAVDNEIVTTRIRLLEEAGLTPTALDAPPCALTGARRWCSAGAGRSVWSSRSPSVWRSSMRKWLVPSAWRRRRRSRSACACRGMTRWTPPRAGSWSMP